MEFPGYLGIPVMEFRVETIWLGVTGVLETIGLGVTGVLEELGTGLGVTGVLEELGTGFSVDLGLRGMVRSGGFLAFSGSTWDDVVDTFISVVPPDLLLVICFDSLWLVCTFAFSL